MAIPELAKLVRPNPPKRLLVFDPGDTTGVASFIDGQIKVATHLRRDLLLFKKVIESFAPDMMVVESYRIYQSKMAQHVHSDVPTLRLIGAIEMLAAMQQVPIVWQSAAEAKGFITDEKLQAWGMWSEDSKHARDAIRHGLYYLIMRKEAKGAS
jgi:hypothetical protein